jgi:deoxyribonuclease-1
MKSFIASLLVVFSLSLFAQQDQKLQDGKWSYYGKDFYDILSSGKRFERSVFNRIFNEAHQHRKGDFDQISTSCQGTCYRQVIVGYESARKIMFGELDKLQDSNGTYVLDVYCGKKFYYKTLSDVSGMHTRVNIEHTWPQSRFNGNFPREMQKSDMHHLYLTDSGANSVRGNTPFGLVGKGENRNESGCESRNGLIDGREVYTPPAPHRGNVARALFYFSLHYNLGISSQEETILRQWHKADPVDANEIRRHEMIAKYQKIRNPFVDHPELVDKIGDF